MLCFYRFKWEIRVYTEKNSNEKRCWCLLKTSNLYLGINTLELVLLFIYFSIKLHWWCDLVLVWSVWSAAAFNHQQILNKCERTRIESVQHDRVVICIFLYLRWHVGALLWHVGSWKEEPAADMKLCDMSEPPAASTTKSKRESNIFIFDSVSSPTQKKKDLFMARATTKKCSFKPQQEMCLMLVTSKYCVNLTSNCFILTC